MYFYVCDTASESICFQPDSNSSCSCLAHCQWLTDVANVFLLQLKWLLILPGLVIVKLLLNQEPITLTKGCQFGRLKDDVGSCYPFRFPNFVWQSRNKGNITGGARGRRRCEPVGGSGGMLPQKILKARGLEMLFPAFSKRDM